MPTTLEADLSRFFAPRSIALVGATEDQTKFGGRCLRQTMDFGFDGAIYPVNPRRDRLFGLDCFASIADLPETPDHVGVVLPMLAVPTVIEACAARGVPFATIFSAGYGETGSLEGRAAQQRIADIARAGGVRLMGPNCNGFVNFVDRVALTSTATIRGPRRTAGDLGVVSQSGGAGQVNVMWRAQQAGLGISYQVSCGNAADLDLVDFAAFMLDSEATRVVMILAESLPDGERVRWLAERAVARDKAIVMIKVGRTEAGGRAAASHTGAVTGSDQVCDAALEQLGIIRVDDCNELYETAMLLRRRRVFGGRSVAATSISGGNLVMLADLGASLGLDWPEYQDATLRRIESVLPGFGRAANPTDLTAGAIGQDGAYEAAAGAILDDPAVDALIPVMTMASAAEMRSVAALADRSTKPTAILWTGGATDDPALTAETLVSEGLAVYRDALPCLRAIDRASRHDAWKSRPACKPARPGDVDVAGALTMLDGFRGLVSEHRSKALLRAYGVPTTGEFLATSPDEAVAQAVRLGTAVALKVQSPDIPHKTEAGAIRLGVRGDAAVRDAYAAVTHAARAYRPDALIEGVLVQEMVDGAVEMFVGLSNDATFGPVVTIGFGGIHVEIFGDVALRLAPVAPLEARRALQSLRAYSLLQGARGAAACDVDALVDCIVRLSWLAADLGGRFEAIDINPIAVMHRGRGVRVLDALVITSEVADRRESKATATLAA